MATLSPTTGRLSKNTYMRPLITILLATLFFGHHTFAQKLLGVASGNNCVMESMFLNPANLGGCDDKYLIPLISTNVFIDNNLGTLSSLGKLMRSNKKKNGNNTSLFTYGGNPKFSMIAPMIELQGPGIIRSIDGLHSLAFTTRLRIFNQFYNFDKLLFQISTNTPDNTTVTADLKNFKWTLHMWSEAGLSYGGVLWRDEKQQLKIGTKVNILGGIAYAGLDGKKLNLAYKSDVDSISANNADLVFSNSISGTDNSISSSQILDNVLGGSGHGFSVDAGLVYVLLKGRKQKNENIAPDHKLSLSLSATDFGYITYNSLTTTSISGSGYISSTGISANVKNFSDFNGYLRSKGFRDETVTKADVVYLPATINAGIDYNFFTSYYASLIYIFNFSNDFNFGNKYFSQVTLTPRYDTKKYSVGIPITYNSLTRNLRFGIGFRAGSFFAGSDDILLLVANHQYGFGFYIGGFLKVGRSQKNQ